MISKCKTLKKKQTGSVLIFIIVSMVIVAVMGTAMFSLLSSSTYSELFMNNRTKAYYLAQAGRNYATFIQNSLPAGDRTAIDEALNGKTLILPEGKIYLSSVTDDKRSYMESTGIVNEGPALETKQKIKFTIESKRFSLDVFAVTSIDLNSGARIDSYDSSIGPYNVTTNRTQKAIVRTNGTAVNSINVVYKSGAYGQIGGDAICGPCGPNLEYCDPNDPFGVIRDYVPGTPPPADLITGTKSSASTTQTYAAVIAPDPCTSFYTCGTIKGLPRTYTKDKVTYTYYEMTGSGTTADPLTLTTGVYRTNIFYFNGKTLQIDGNVTLIVVESFTNNNVRISTTGNLDMIRASNIFISPTGSLDLYVLRVATFGADCRINPPCRGGVATTPCADGVDQTPATALRFLGITTTQLNFNSQETYGGVSAPGAICAYTAYSHFFGTVSCNTITMTGGGIHVDKAFSSTGGGAGAGSNVVY
jgi:hypothetical protein